MKNMDNSSTEDQDKNKRKNEDMEDINDDKKEEKYKPNTKDMDQNKTQNEDMEDINKDLDNVHDSDGDHIN